MAVKTNSEPQPSLPENSQPPRRPAHSIHNRLESITSDSLFATRVSHSYGLPLIANERCGSWYISPALKTGSAYFKSTDGHVEEWGFSLRRVNLQLLEVIAERDGAIIVDSTRRKIMPDSISKTIPIWCCVMNRAIFPNCASHHQLYTPQDVVSASEHEKIERRIDGFVRQFLDVCRPDLEYLRSRISKPLRPIWITQSSELPESIPQYPDMHPLILCTASRRVTSSESSESGYVQGAADDHEAWSGGLTPTLFWKHKTQLLETNEEELPALIKKIALEEEASDAAPILVEPTANLFVSATQNLDTTPFDVVISCGAEPLPIPNPTPGTTQKKNYLHLKCQNGKPGSRDLRSQLPHLVPFFSALTSPPRKILVCCPTGKDLSVGVALAILCLYVDENGDMSSNPREQDIDKVFIKQRLNWLTKTNASLNPSRKTLLSIHAFLMPDPSV
ncbi:unnamed protein product [Periconia digitata]|uniref:Initiator tRNA phosphoribosyl transferase n=1 Tax=Periconia digitata TaxID=1303443 RepID=A0A9W4UDZ3_9PLEO|nr:unnamed protein product [Periconia digitata]